MTDMINHPPHYKSKNGLEAIDVIEAFDLDHHEACAVKYILRAGKKGDGMEDIKKARWYLDRKINQQHADALDAALGQAKQPIRDTTGQWIECGGAAPLDLQQGDLVRDLDGNQGQLLSPYIVNKDAYGVVGLGRFCVHTGEISAYWRSDIHE